MSYVVFGRAIKNEYLTLATIAGTAGLVFGARAAFSKKEPAKPVSSGSVIERVKEAIPINAGSSEEEDFIRKFIEEAEKETKH